MNYWDILGIEQTDDIKSVKKAYAKMSKQYHPETHPNEFKKLHTAYKAVMSMIKCGNLGGADVIAERKPIVQTEIIRTAEDKNTSRYTDFLELVYRKYNSKKQIESEDALISKFRELITDERNNYAPALWRRFFTGDEFLEKQYKPEFIHGMAEVIEKYMRDSSDKRRRIAGRVPTFMLLYCIIAYGCMFETVGLVEIKEKVYRKEKLEELKNALQLQDSLLSDYLIAERRDELIGERFAFYVYRNVLELLEYENPDRKALKVWLTDGLAKENRTHVLELLHYEPYQGVAVGNCRREKDKIQRSSLVFELLEYLLNTKHYNLEVLEEVLREVCKAGGDYTESREEKEILLLVIEGNQQARRNLYKGDT